MTTNQEAINAGARAVYRSVNRGHADTKGWDEVKPNWQKSYRRDATAAYAAMAPIIAAQAKADALREAAEVLDNRNDRESTAIKELETKTWFSLAGCWSVVRHDRIRARWLRARAAGIEAGK